jgi:hypothetical protein
LAPRAGSRSELRWAPAGSRTAAEMRPPTDATACLPPATQQCAPPGAVRAPRDRGNRTRKMALRGKRTSCTATKGTCCRRCLVCRSVRRRGCGCVGCSVCRRAAARLPVGCRCCVVFPVRRPEFGVANTHHANGRSVFSRQSSAFCEQTTIGSWLVDLPCWRRLTSDWSSAELGCTSSQERGGAERGAAAEKSTGSSNKGLLLPRPRRRWRKEMKETGVPGKPSGA